MKRLYNFFLAFFPILSSYGFSPSVDFGSILLFLLGLAIPASLMDFSIRPFNSLSESIREIKSFVIPARGAFAACPLPPDFASLHEKKLNDKARTMRVVSIFLDISRIIKVYRARFILSNSEE